MAYGTLSWHPSDCGNDYCDDRHWDALLEVGKFRVLLRVTEHTHVFGGIDKWRGAAYLTEKVNDGKAAPLLLFCEGAWSPTQASAVDTLTWAVEGVMKKVIELADDIKRTTVYPLPRR